jgi:hypothetical protein
MSQLESTESTSIKPPDYQEASTQARRQEAKHAAQLVKAGKDWRTM